MGTWGTAIKDNDAFADIYSEFFELYNDGGQPSEISEKIIKENWEILEIEEEKHSLWFALALAQWETKSLDAKVLETVDTIITSGADLIIWAELGASENDLSRRKIALDTFLEKLKSDKPKAKSRKRIKVKTPVFSTGDCFIFKLQNGNYGGAVVLATDTNPATGNNLVATTRLNCSHKPSPDDIEKTDVLVCNFGQHQERPDVTWHAPDLYQKNYAHLYELIGNIKIEIEYDPNDYEGKNYLFRPSWTAGWSMKDIADLQFEFEKTNPKPKKAVTIKELTKKPKRWKLF